MSKNLGPIAKALRKTATKAEQVLWNCLKSKQLRELKFRRQQPIGRYIADFVCFDKRLVIEVDGGQHAEENKDMERDRWFRGQGFRVLRFWNNEVLQNLNGVLEFIMQNVSPSPNPSHQGRGKHKIG